MKKKYETMNPLDLINVGNRASRASWRNQEKLNNLEIESGEKISLGGNLFVSFCPSRYHIDKRFYWGNREIKKDTMKKRLINLLENT